MKRKWHIQTRLLVTLICLTCSVLVVVALSFNLSVHGYIRSRVSTQLTAVTMSASEDRRTGDHGRGKRFDEHPDRITGTRANGILLNKDGQLLDVLHGDEGVARELAEYVQNHGLYEEIQNQVISIDSGTYAVSATGDPAEDGNLLLVYVDVTALMAFTHQINLVLLFVILAAILLSVILSRRFARAFSEPVGSLTDFADQIGRGDLTPRELRFSDVEFNSLADSMNRMAADLLTAKQKQEIFFQNVSHELRTPLTSIRGNAEGIVYGIMEPQNAAKIILSESDKLGGMVEDILYLSRLGKAAPETAAEPLDLREVLSLCASEQRAEAENKGVVFRYDFDTDAVTMPIREQDAQRLFGNLISNAVRYAEREIVLSCHEAEFGVTVSVADDGKGVSPEDLPHVFERFYKGPDGNHGIGLSIARSVAAAYHGSLSVRNDRGAVFTVVFPQKQA